MHDALARLRWSDTVPPDLLADVGFAELPAMAAALDRIHRPERADDPLLEPAWRRVRFEELLAQQLSLRRSRRVRATQVAHPLPDGTRAESLVKALPFRLTAAQRRVWKEIRDDLGRSQPMNRLLQGDVGSGKTVVAALAALQAVGSGRQAALMAPTEMLARQHLDKLAPWLEPTGVRIGWLVGALTPAAKRKARANRRRRSRFRRRHPRADEDASSSTAWRWRSWTSSIGSASPSGWRCATGATERSPTS